MTREEDIRGNLRIYDNRVAERDVMYLLNRVAELDAALRGNYEFPMPDGSLCFCFTREGRAAEEHYEYCRKSRAALEPKP